MNNETLSPGLAIGRPTRINITSAEALVVTASSAYAALFVGLDRLGAGSADHALLGVVVGVGFITNFAAQVGLARLGDQGQTKRLLLAGIALEVLALVGLATAAAPGTAIAARSVMGFAEGIIYPTLRRQIVVTSDPRNVGRRLGRLSSADMAGFIIGPLLVASIGRSGPITPVFLLLAVAATCSLVPAIRAPAGDKLLPPQPVRGTSAALLKHRSFQRALAIGVGLYVTVGAFDALWAVVHRDLGSPVWITTIGVVLLPIPRILVGARGGEMAQRVGPYITGTIGVGIGAVALAAYGAAPSGAVILVVALLHWLADGYTAPSRLIAVATTIPPHQQATAQGLIGGIETLAAGIAAIIAGVSYSLGGQLWAFAVSAGIVTLALGVSLSLARPARPPCGCPRTARSHATPCTRPVPSLHPIGDPTRTTTSPTYPSHGSVADVDAVLVAVD